MVSTSNPAKAIAILLTAVLSTLASYGQQTIFTKPAGYIFDYPAGTTLAGKTEANGETWANAGPAGPDVQVQAGNLFVAGGETSIGNHAELAAVNGPAARIGLSSNVTSGAVYYSFILSVSDTNGLGTAGGTIVGLNSATGGSQNLPDPLAARVLLRSHPDGYQIGLSKTSGNPGDATWSPEVFSPSAGGIVWLPDGAGPLRFLVVSYEFNPGNGDDVVSLWINPSPADFDMDSAPAPTLTNTAGADISQIQSIVLMQQPAPAQPALTEVDEIRAGTTWASVTPRAADYGDAPNTYRTRRGVNGARHGLVGPVLGSLRDRDRDGRPSVYANADDVFDGTDDEDGVTFPAYLLPGVSNSVAVYTASGGTLDAWIDFNANGVFNHPIEQIANSLYLLPGTTTVSFFMPPGMPDGGTYARFRISESGGLLPIGAADNGEVEDYGPATVIVDSSGGNPIGQNLTLSLVQVDDEITVSNSAMYTLVVSNSGSVAVSNIEITSLHDGAPLTSLTGIPVGAGICQVVDSEVQCSLNLLNPGQTAFFDIFTEISDSGASDEEVYFSAWVDVGGPDLSPFDNVVSGRIRWIVKDWGDAPTGYPVTRAENGASHMRRSTWRLGSGWDGERNGTHSASADHDDTTDIDDEDGVSVISGTGTITLEVTAARAGYLDAWADFQRDMDWDDAGEQIFTSYPLSAGPNVLSVVVPGYATTGDLVTRWRFSRSGGLTYEGFGGAGEVEDHIISWTAEDGNLDYGDAPNSYKTLQIDDGARHTIVSGMVLGAYIDFEVDGQPSSDALLDDTTSTSGHDDEDGIKFLTPLIEGATSVVEVIAYPATKLDAWVDFNGNGQFDHPGIEQIFTNQAVGPGTTTLEFVVPYGSTNTDTFARFRLSSSGSLAPTGAASDGEVEDYMVSISSVDTNENPTLDYGDAPDSYLTLEASGGPSHTVTNFWSIGKDPDAEYDGFPTTSADGDDTNDTDDEDGFNFGSTSGSGIIIPGATNLVDFSFSVPSGETGYLNIWVDYGRDGSFAETNDHMLVDLTIPGFAGGGVSSGSIVGYSKFFTAVAVPGDTYARCRLSSVSGVSYGGYDPRGEVEDIIVTIGTYEQTNWANVSAQLIGVPDAVNEGDQIVYSIMVSNSGPATATSVQLVGDLPELMTTDAISSSYGNAYLQGNKIICNIGSIAQFESVTVQVVLGTETLIDEDTSIETVHTAQSWSLTYDEVDFNPGDNTTDATSSIFVHRDFADAPDTFHTLISSDGPRHRIRPGWRMGALIDPDDDGMPTLDAGGDDLDDGVDDEDGVSEIAPLVRGTIGTVQVDVLVPTASNGYINAWMDWNHDLLFNGPGEHVIIDELVSSGTENISFPIPVNAVIGLTYARFRLSGYPGISYDGWVAMGEVEDYGVNLYQMSPTQPVVLEGGLSFSNSVVTLQWNAETGISYQVQCNTNLLNSNGWIDVGPYVIGPDNWYTNSILYDEQFYRVVAPWVE